MRASKTKRVGDRLRRAPSQRWDARPKRSPTPFKLGNTLVIVVNDYLVALAELADREFASRASQRDSFGRADDFEFTKVLHSQQILVKHVYPSARLGRVRLREAEAD